MAIIPIDGVISKQVISVKPDMPIFEAMELLVEHAISGMPVVDDEGHLKGILTEKDVLEILVKKDFAVKDTVATYMSRDVISFPPDADAAEICRFFIKSNVRRVPIIKDGKLVGVISRRDMIKLILDYVSKLSSEHRYS
ncbi:MAG: CBS domain-containing protein [Candidatus Omnitrophota bacterium]